MSRSACLEDSAGRDRVQPSAVRARAQPPRGSLRSRPEASPAAGPERLLELERGHILRLLRETHGNKSEAARRLGIERKTLYKKALRLGIDLQTDKE